MRGKPYRRYMEHVKWIKRVKYHMPKNPEYWVIDRKVKLWYPDINECLDSKHFKIFKTTGKPCSCDMCSYYKYDRIEFKKDTIFELKNAA